MGQLRKSPSEHFQDIVNAVRYAEKCGLTVNVYPEDWSQGMRNSREYVMELVACLCDLPIKRVIAPGYTGGSSSRGSRSVCPVDDQPLRHTVRFPWP